MITMWCTTIKNRSHRSLEWEHIGLGTVRKKAASFHITFPGTNGSSFAHLAKPRQEPKSAQECHRHRIAKPLTLPCDMPPTCSSVDKPRPLFKKSSTQQLSKVCELLSVSNVILRYDWLCLAL